MLWPYQQKPIIGKIGRRTRQFSFAYEEPIRNISAIIRDNQSSDACIFSEVFDRRYYDFSLSYEPETILDVGANVGFATLFFSRKYPSAKLACVEPMSENLAILKKNLSLNAVKAAVFPAAISVADGTIEMEFASQDCGHKVANIPFGNPATGETVTVRAISVPTVLETLQWKEIGLLKLDVEGYEGVLLRQCDWLKLVKVLCLECHEGYGEADLKALAIKYGFRPPTEFRGIWLLVRY